MSSPRPAPRTVAITREAGLKRHLQRLSSATGGETTILGTLEELDSASAPALIFLDARGTKANAESMLRRLPAKSYLMLLTTDEVLYELMPLLGDPRVVSLVAYDDKFDATGWVVAAAKALKGELYGVEKYFNWGVHTETHEVQNYDEKSATIERLKQFAQVAGYRGPVRERILGVTDELLMNALYHAPVDQRGKPLYREVPRGEISRVPLAAPVTVQYATDGASFAVGVRDHFGSVNRETLVSYLTRASAGQADIEQKTSGAGLGLATVMRSASRLVFNLDSSQSLEVIALFDYELAGKHARAVHVFTSGAAASASAAARHTIDLGSNTPIPTQASKGGGGRFFLGAFLALGLAGGAAWVARDDLLPLVTKNELQLGTEPSGAEVLVNGRAAGRVTPVQLPIGPGRHRVLVRRAGYRDLELDVRRLIGETALDVNLTPEPSATLMPASVGTAGATRATTASGATVPTPAAAAAAPTTAAAAPAPRSEPAAPSRAPRSEPAAPSRAPRSEPAAPSRAPRSEPAAPSRGPRSEPAAPSRGPGKEPAPAAQPRIPR